MIQHIVLVKWKPGTDEDQVLSAFRKARHLPDEIAGVESIVIGRNRGNQQHGFTHALIVRLADEEALGRYLDHPLRRRYIAEQLAPIEEERIEIDVPVTWPCSATRPRGTGSGAPASAWACRRSDRPE